MTTPPVPTNLLPENLSTVNSSYFAVGCTLGVHPVKQKAQWQVATDTAFTASLHTIDSAYSNPGALSGMVTSPRIPQGNAYLRVRSVEQTSGDVSAWSAYKTVLISHPPKSLLLSPANSENVVWESGVVDFEWQFSDESAPDVQTAYQLKVLADSSDNSYATVATVYEDYTAMQAANLTYDALVFVDIFGEVYNSGKVTSSINQLSVMLPVQYKNVPIRWNLQTWDDDDITSEPLSSNLFFVSDAPVISISYPSTTITTPTPTITWTYFSESSSVQSRYNLKIIDSATSSYVYDSGWVSSASNSHAVPALLLKNAKSYVLSLTVVSANGMTAVKQKAFTSQWSEPSNPSFSITTDDYQLENKVYLNWTGAPKSTTFVEWRIYRRESSSAPWESVGSTDLFIFIDYFPYPNDTTQYSVTQLAVLFGEYVESSFVPVSVDLSTSKYLLIVRDSPEVFLMFDNVVSDSYEIEREEFVMNVLGSGRKSEVGTNMGIKGSLDIHFRDMGTVGSAAADLRSIENIINENAVCVLRTPFEKKYQVHIGNLSVGRIAGVVSGITDVSLDYAEVI